MARCAPAEFSTPACVAVWSRTANTTAATIPTALHQCREEGRVGKGDLVVLAAFGAGFTWGATLLKWAY